MAEEIIVQKNFIDLVIDNSSIVKTIEDSSLIISVVPRMKLIVTRDISGHKHIRMRRIFFSVLVVQSMQKLVDFNFLEVVRNTPQKSATLRAFRYIFRSFLKVAPVCYIVIALSAFHPESNAYAI